MRVSMKKTLKILYEDNQIIAVDKPPGVLTQQDSSGVESLLDMVREYIREKYSKPGRVFLGLVHRLDRQVSGVVVFARTSKAASRLFREFQERSILKIYCALVHRPAEGSPDDRGGEWVYLFNDLVRRGSTTILAPSQGEAVNAALAYRIISSDDRYLLLLIKLLTGRKHQIRAQLSAAGMPVAGDRRYGSPERHPDKSICLHSYLIRVKHPTRDHVLEIKARIPDRIRMRIDVPEIDPHLLDL